MARYLSDETKAFLSEIAEEINFTLACGIYLPQYLQGGSSYIHNILRKKKRLARIERAGYISLQPNHICLTKKGLIYALKNCISREKKQLPKGECLFIGFDVPESKRADRNRLRRELKSLGFQQIQKSVFITQRDVISLIQKYIEYRDLKSYVVLITGKIN